MMACFNIFSGIWVAAKIQLSSPSGLMNDSRHNFEVIRQDSSLGVKKGSPGPEGSERKNAVADTPKKTSTKHVKPGPQRSKWAISRKGESVTE